MNTVQEQSVGDMCNLLQLEDVCPDVDIAVVDTVHHGNLINEYIGYIIRINKPFQKLVQRRYSEFYALRQAMLKEWPGCFIPCLPDKQIIGSNSLKVVKERMKELTYFLNSVAKIPYLLQSEEFHFFLTSPNSDLVRYYEFKQKISFGKKLQKYRKTFPELAEQVRPYNWNNLAIRSKQFLEVLMAQLRQNHIPMVNINREVQALAEARDEDVATTRLLFNEAIPGFQKYLKLCNAANQDILFTKEDNVQPCNLASELQYPNNINAYWILCDALKLQINESKAAQNAIQSLKDVERAQVNINRQLNNNIQELHNIEANNFSLRQLMSNKNELLKEIKQQNELLTADKQVMEQFLAYVQAVALEKLMVGYHEKRANIWKRVWKLCMQTEVEFSGVLKQFYESFK